MAITTGLKVTRPEALSTPHENIRFGKLRKDNHSNFNVEVDKHISSSYFETGPIYGSYLIQQSEDGYDQDGVFTSKKLCLEAFLGKELFAYVVLTFKRGGSVKTGPVVVLEKFRNKGHGVNLRMALHSFLRTLGHRKVYVSIPTVNKPAFHYLLKAQYTIESHLKKHYHDEHDELVFGFMLEENATDCTSTDRRHALFDKMYKMRSQASSVALFISRRFSQTYFPVVDDWIDRQVHLASKCARGSYAGFKSRFIFVAESNGRVAAVILCVQKRGGSTKLVLLSDTDHTDSLVAFLEYVTKALVAQNEDLRKVYAHVAVSDAAFYTAFTQAGYNLEGVIKRPYNPYNDMLIMAKEAV